ncbi:MAG: HD domain-containing phosphohydrolase, partial [Elusimicrobiota bacterium]
LLLIDIDDFINFSKSTLPSAQIKCIVFSKNASLPEEFLESPLIHDWFVDTPSPEKLFFSIMSARANYLKAMELSNLESSLLISQKDLQELNRIGAALSAEHNIDLLLNMIVEKIMETTQSDAGSLYLVKEKPNIPPDHKDSIQNKQLIFKLTKNYSVDVRFTEHCINIDRKSISGTVALTGKPWNISDVYDLPTDSEVQTSKEFDSAIGYRTKSMLTIPMKTHEDEVIGVIQLINKKRKYKVRLNSPELTNRYAVPFNANDEALALSLASQAAVALENAILYENITNLFEGFIRASVTAIESRDPTTSGHSERVADLTLWLAKEMNNAKMGPFAEIFFSEMDLRELRYASLLHDFGKIGVRENILLKSHKLFQEEMDRIRYRFSLIKKSLNINFLTKKAELLKSGFSGEIQNQINEIETRFKQECDRFDNYFNFVKRCNEPFPLNDEDIARLAEIKDCSYKNDDGNDTNLLNVEEFKRLSIKKGSLSDNERSQMEDHVIHTFKFLAKIPWTRELKKIPNIAGGHHERLDGSGYPRGVRGESLSIESQMIAIADLYDALTASDRPYKKALPCEKALQIIDEEVKNGKINKDLYDIFVEKSIYKQTYQPRGLPCTGDIPDMK